MLEGTTLSRDGSKHATSEKFNTASHLIAACFSILGASLLITKSISSHNVWQIVSASVYSFSLITLFVFSTLHHGLNSSKKVNEIMRTFDYVAVFALIAGTVTPLVLVSSRTVFGWCVFGAVWAIAACGIALRSSIQSLPKYITNTMYIVLGWLPITLLLGGINIPTAGTVLLAVGGLFYSFGFAIYVLEKPNPKPGHFGFHEIWHLLVMGGALCHFLLIYQYVIS